MNQHIVYGSKLEAWLDTPTGWIVTGVIIVICLVCVIYQAYKEPPKHSRY